MDCRLVSDLDSGASLVPMLILGLVGTVLTFGVPYATVRLLML